MTNDKQTIITNIKNHISSRGGGYSDWYVGIAEDPEKRLSEHNVNLKSGDIWIYDHATSSDVAREVEKYFIEILKTDGGGGGGSDSSDYVYAYKKNQHTKP
jgi:hypothetical protein